MANGQNKKLVSVRNLNFKYNNDYILNDINLDIFKGKMLQFWEEMVAENLL